MECRAQLLGSDDRCVGALAETPEFFGNAQRGNAEFHERRPIIGPVGRRRLVELVLVGAEDAAQCVAQLAEIVIGDGRVQVEFSP